jgi:DNA-directed RNA polymerase subunit beta
LEIFKTYGLTLEDLNKIFNEKDFFCENYDELKPLEAGINMPQFLFTVKNSYFDIGKLGRKKFNVKTNIISQLKNQTLSRDLLGKDGSLILKKDSIISGENLEFLEKNISRLEEVEIPKSSNSLYIVKVKSPKDADKEINVVGNYGIDESKVYFDLSDLICISSIYMNLHHGLGKVEGEEEKDELGNQVVRRVGDLIYNIFDNKFGGFLQDIDNKYLANISQLKKADLNKIPNLKDFDNLIKHFFNTSALVQLQNQNNPLSEASYTRKLSVLGLGGFSSANTTYDARNVKRSYYGRYDLVETPEGQKVGLIHNLAVGAEINSYGQVVARYFPVKDGKIQPEIVYLASEEEREKYMAHSNIRVNENSEILEDEVVCRYEGELVRVKKEKIDYIDSSFYQLNSITSATIPFFQHNDATRMLMASNMQRQALTLIKSQAPLVASGMEASLLENSSMVVKALEDGIVRYVDSRKIIVGNEKEEDRIYELKQLVVSNKNILNFSIPLVKKGEKVEKDQILSHGNYADSGELALGYNLRVAYLC